MEIHFDELLEKITNFIQSETKTETIIGDVFKLGEFNCAPVIKVGFGFGSGGGEGSDTKKRKATAGAAGAGVGIEPIGFLVSKDSEISFISTEKHSGLAAVFEKVPDLIEKVMDQKKASKDVT